jgi:putative addiction module component (TIGR02574 family)
MESEERHTLAKLLRLAATEMEHRGPIPIWGLYGTCEQLGRYLRTSALQIDAEQDIQLPLLWVIFAPTCFWDDARGSPELGNYVFECLERLGARDQLPLTEAQLDTLDRRIAELDANPDNVLTWEEIKARVRGQSRA